MKLSSKEKIKIAFIDLLKTKGLENVTITDITRKAKINRGTFYLSYADKYELLYTLENEIIESVLYHLSLSFCMEYPLHEPENIRKRIDSYKKFTITILEIIYNEKELIQALISPSGDPSFVKQFQKEVFRKLFSDNFFHINNNLFTKMPPDYLEEVILNGLSSIIIHWLSKDCREPIEEIATILNFTNFAAPIHAEDY